ncbi:hypothetical protein I7634_00265 [Mycoplasma mycoides subsp. capri]|uniref:hypothetical protein n=1 Tax=Mycoplasma mycoides TaxID=2102 RepID=UPI0022404397|nr:hypothetical protein [Mycoplasma mycoides]QVJ96379.1 hypothetical protein I7632_00265 [Mycoplasma mycoides subsp. capri]QVJ97277.1 hypothetical protein I7633_00265 [Mycoplasma mycoides subsp. capri]QVK00261.1 hypothetical protein I7634_00265 [Mycoplasma mycoides subsp. capri]QVK01145.1 hypothetical protein I7635_00265 [Mycoplasma mycoides subsp. capri]UZK64242.1 hypothetical protein MNF30_00235 [Mycoplasma mycoides subsp. capri]
MFRKIFKILISLVLAAIVILIGIIILGFSADKTDLNFLQRATGVLKNHSTLDLLKLNLPNLQQKIGVLLVIYIGPLIFLTGFVWNFFRLLFSVFKK